MSAVIDGCARGLRLILEAVTIGLLVLLAVVVVLAVVFRFAGSSFIWYDEVASVMLAWITYYGAALAALRRRHLGFSAFLLSLPPLPRRLVFLLGEAVIYATFGAVAWAGWYVLGVMAGETLVSLDWVPLQVTQSVVPIGCVLFILAHALATPQAWARIKAGRAQEAEEIEEEIARAAGRGGGEGRDSGGEPPR